MPYRSCSNDIVEEMRGRYSIRVRVQTRSLPSCEIEMRAVQTTVTSRARCIRDFVTYDQLPWHSSKPDGIYFHLTADCALSSEITLWLDQIR